MPRMDGQLACLALLRKNLYLSPKTKFQKPHLLPFFA